MIRRKFLGIVLSLPFVSNFISQDDAISNAIEELGGFRRVSTSLVKYQKDGKWRFGYIKEIITKQTEAMRTAGEIILSGHKITGNIHGHPIYDKVKSCNPNTLIARIPRLNSSINRVDHVKLSAVKFV